MYNEMVFKSRICSWCPLGIRQMKMGLARRIKGKDLESCVQCSIVKKIQIHSFIAYSCPCGTNIDLYVGLFIDIFFNLFPLYLKIIYTHRKRGVIKERGTNAVLEIIPTCQQHLMYFTVSVFFQFLNIIHYNHMYSSSLFSLLLYTDICF